MKSSYVQTSGCLYIGSKFKEICYVSGERDKRDQQDKNLND
jgi:hypothetical protein